MILSLRINIKTVFRLQTLVHLVQDLARHVQDRTVEHPIHTVDLARNVVEVVAVVQVGHPPKLVPAPALVLIPNKLPENSNSNFRRFCLQFSFDIK